MSSTDNTGLGLFDDAASAAGSFPTALRGYERTAVDDYVRGLEANVVATRRHAQELLEQVARLQEQTAEESASQADYSDLGGRASEILRLAQEQARDLTENAGVEAERTKELARREADTIRRDALRQGEELKTGGVAQIDQLRTRLHHDLQAQIDRARVEGEAVVAAARRQAEALTRQAEHEAQTVRQTAYLDTEGLRRAVEREVAEARQEIATAREQAIAELAGVHEQADAETASLLREATAFHAEAAERLEADITEAARIRAEAVAEAEATKVAAAEEADARLAAARQEVAVLRERTQQEFSWRKQQLRRETELLGQRKQAVLGQLASLSALAQQTAQTFPDLDDLGLGDLTDEPGSTAPAFDGPSETAEDDDETRVVAPVGDDDTRLVPVVGGEDQAEATLERPVPEAPEEAGDGTPENEHAGESETTLEVDDIEIDGDATILISAADLPAGTEHLQRPAPEHR